MEEYKNNESETIMFVNRKENDVTELVIKNGTYVYEMLNSILLLFNKMFELSNIDTSLDENLDAKFKAVEEEYKARFLNKDIVNEGVIDGEETESTEEN